MIHTLKLCKVKSIEDFTENEVLSFNVRREIKKGRVLKRGIRTLPTIRGIVDYPLSNGNYITYRVNH